MFVDLGVGWGWGWPQNHFGNSCEAHKPPEIQGIGLGGAENLCHNAKSIEGDTVKALYKDADCSQSVYTPGEWLH